MCESCSQSTASRLAEALPPEGFSISRANVLDATSGELRAYTVSVFYDYEFDTWFRFARAVAPSANAEATRAHFVALRDGVANLTAEGLSVPVASAAQWLTHTDSAGALDTALAATGLPALASSAGSLAAYAFDTNNLLDIRFADDSHATVRLDTGPQGLQWQRIAGALADPDGLPLPDSLNDLGRLHEIGDSGRVGYLRLFVQDSFGVSTWLRAALDHLSTYRFICTTIPEESECRIEWLR